MPTLLFENGPQRGNGIEIASGRTYTVGRDERCDVVLDDDLISRQHCQIKEFKGAWYLRDLDSRNGVLVNDQRVAKSQIRFGDKLQFGDTVCTFFEESLDQIRAETTLGGYLLREHIGRGGMGTVYRALQLSLEREVALKVLSPDLVKDPQFIKQFRTEARAAGQLNHPNIVQVYDVGEEGDTFFYSMEYVGGGSLEDLLRERGKIEAEEAIAIVHQAALALEFAESKGIVHRDIKPDNLMLTEDGRIKLADLGLALTVGSGGTDHKRQPILGTPHFISPEQALRQDVDSRSDIYSLGATFYRMLSGRTVFQGSSAEEIIKKAVKEEPKPIRELVPEVPEKVAAVVHKMLQKNPDHRQVTATELREELEQLMRRPARTIALWSASAVATIALGIALFLFIRGPKTEKEFVQVEDQAAKEKYLRERDSLQKMTARLDASRRLQKALIGAILGGARPDDVAAIVRVLPRDQREPLSAELVEWKADEDYQYLGDLPEQDLVDQLLKGIERVAAEEAAEMERLETERLQRIQAITARVDHALAGFDYGAALIAADKFDPQAEEAGRARQEAKHCRSELLEKAHTAARNDYQSRREAIDAAMVEGRTDHEAKLCLEACVRFPEPGEGVPAPYMKDLATWSNWFEERSTEVNQRLAAAQRDAELADLRLVVEAHSDSLRSSILALELATAADHVKSAADRLSTEAYKDSFAPTLARLNRAAPILARLFTDLEAGKLSTEPKVRVADMHRSGEVVGYDSAKRGVRVRLTLAIGESTFLVDLEDFATPDGLCQLVKGRMSLTPEETLDLCGFLVILQAATWAQELWPLQDVINQYNEQLGWSEDMSIAIGRNPSGTDAHSALAKLLRDLPEEHAAAAQAIKDELQKEQECYLDLRGALSPFLVSEPNIGWTAATQRMEQLLDVRRDTLLLRMVYTLLDSAFEHPLGGK